jgi:hypothetical protein
MSGALVVVRPFGRYKQGDLIIDTKTMRETLAGENARSVVATHLPSQPPAQEG